MTGTVVIEKRDADGVWRELDEPHPYRARITHAPSARDLWDIALRPRNTIIRPSIMFVPSDTAKSIRDELGQEQERARIAAPLPTKHPLAVGTRVWVTGFNPGIDGEVRSYQDGLYRIRGFYAEYEQDRVAVFDPHWNEKRAYRQGKTIQCRGRWANAEWGDCTPECMGVPVWNAGCEYRVEPGTPPPAAKPRDPRSEEPWHARFERAMKAGVPVQYRESEDHAWQDNRGGTALSYCYGEGNYRIGGEVDPYGHLKAAALMGLQIQRRTRDGRWINRPNKRVYTHWTDHPSNYRVQPQEA